MPYQLNGRGRNGEKHWNLYVEPFVVHKGDRVAVQAFRVGYKKSEIVDFLIEHYSLYSLDAVDVCVYVCAGVVWRV